MSAFLVGKPHIDALVALALFGPRDGKRWSAISWYAEPVDASTSLAEAQRVYRTASAETANKIGQMLLDANRQSIAARYGADAPELGETSKHYRVSTAQLHLRRRPTALEGLKAISCFDYQACEYAGWRTSEARRFLDTLERALISALPGWDQADGWEWRG